VEPDGISYDIRVWGASGSLPLAAIGRADSFAADYSCAAKDVLPSMEPIEVVSSSIFAWAEGDVARTLEHFANDCVYDIHIPEGIVDFSGIHVGKDAIQRCLLAIREEFDFLAYAADSIRYDGECVKLRIVFYYIHRTSGEYFEGSCRHVTRVIDGKIVRVDEYHDVAMLKAFVDMARRQR
jgi:ketosteroid isomerase-like protein